MATIIENAMAPLFKHYFDIFLNRAKSNNLDADTIALLFRINQTLQKEWFDTNITDAEIKRALKPVKNSKQKSNRPFFNQATIIVKLDPLRKVNVKIFSNGKIQMTGVKNVNDGDEALELIIEKLKVTKGVVPFDKILDTQLEKYKLTNYFLNSDINWNYFVLNFGFKMI